MSVKIIQKNQNHDELPHAKNVMQAITCLESASLVAAESFPSLFGGNPANEDNEWPKHLTDVRLAELFIKLNLHRIRFWHDAGQWMDYDGKQWRIKAPGGPYKFIMPMLSPMLDKVKKMPDGVKRDGVLKALLARESTPGQNNLVKAAEKLVVVCVETPDLDRDAMLFNCYNGTVNLITGELQPHNPEDFITKISDVMFDPSAKCPLFDKFINRIMDGDNELVKYMQRFLGYCLTGSVVEHIMQIRFGEGQNGKSVLSNIEGALLGNYAKAAGGYLLLKQPNGGNDNTTQTELAKLRGTRLARISEIDDGVRLAEAQLKNITGGDTITCRAVYSLPIEYDPAFKITLLCNHTPNVQGTDFAIWRRIHKVPFSVTIQPEEKDPKLLDKLRAELPGILNWAIAGCLEWQKTGLNPPKAVLDATEEYKTSEDIFASWLTDCCNLGAQYSTKASSLLESFVKYSGWKGTSHKKFGSLMKEHGFAKSKSNGVIWNGLELLELLNPFSEKSHESNLYSHKFPKNTPHGSNGSKKSIYEDQL